MMVPVAGLLVVGRRCGFTYCWCFDYWLAFLKLNEDEVEDGLKRKECGAWEGSRLRRIMIIWESDLENKG